MVDGQNLSKTSKETEDNFFLDLDLWQNTKQKLTVFYINSRTCPHTNFYPITNENPTNGIFLPHVRKPMTVLDSGLCIVIPDSKY